MNRQYFDDEEPDVDDLQNPYAELSAYELDRIRKMRSERAVAKELPR